MGVELILNIKELSYDDFLLSRDNWNRALYQSLDNHVFLSWEWLAIWWKHYGAGRKFLCVIAENDGEIVAAAPLMVKPRSFFGFRLKEIGFLGNPLSDYNTFLILDGYQKCIPNLLKYAEDNSGGWDYANFRDVPNGSKTLDLLEGIVDQIGLQISLGSKCHRLMLPRTFDEYFRSLSLNFRHTLRNRERALSKGNQVRFFVCKNKSEIPFALKSFFNFNIKWCQKKGTESCLVTDPKAMSFYRDIAYSFMEKGWLALNLLTVNDEPVSAAFNFVHGDKFYAYLPGANPEFTSFGVGNIQILFLIKYAFENGLTEFDFLRGTESYKQRWNAVPNFNVQFRKMRSPVLHLIYNSISNSSRAQMVMGTLLKDR